MTALAPSVVGRVKISDVADTLIRKWWNARLQVLCVQRDAIRKGRKISDLTGQDFEAFEESVEQGRALLREYEAYCRDFQGDPALDLAGPLLTECDLLTLCSDAAEWMRAKLKNREQADKTMALVQRLDDAVRGVRA